MLLSDTKEDQRTTPFDMLMLNLRTRGMLDRRAFLVAIHSSFSLKSVSESSVVSGVFLCVLRLDKRPKHQHFFSCTSVKENTFSFFPVWENIGCDNVM